MTGQLFHQSVRSLFSHWGTISGSKVEQILLAVCMRQLLLPKELVLEDLWRVARKKQDTECLCLDSAHMLGLEDLAVGVTTVCFSPSFGRLLVAGCGDSSIPVSWRSAGSGGMWGRFLGVTLYTLHVLSLSSQHRHLCKSWVYLFVQLILSSPCALQCTATEGSLTGKRGNIS